MGGESCTVLRLRLMRKLAMPRICFILDEFNTMDSGSLVRLNTQRANGEVPRLFEGGSPTTLMTQCKKGAQNQGPIIDASH